MENPLPRRWRHEEPLDPCAAVAAPKTSRRRLKIVLVLGAMAGLVAAIAAILTSLGPHSSPHFLPLIVTAQSSRAVPAVPMAAADRDGMKSGGHFASANKPERLDGERLRQQLADLKKRTAGDSLVVYLAAHAVRTGDGALHVLPADADPDDRGTWVTLRQVLESLRACPAHSQLLVLDVMRPADLSRLGAVQRDVAAAIPVELDAIPDPRRLVLAACAPGQTALVSNELGRSVFSHYLDEGLRGYADGQLQDSAPDGRVTVAELAAFVRARVDRWAVKNRGQRQTPVLYGSGSDFAVAVLERGQRREHLPSPKPRAYPPALLEAWQGRDACWTSAGQSLSPRAFQQMQASLMECERDVERMSEARLAECHDMQVELTRQQKLKQPKPASLAQAERAGARLDPTVKKAVHDLMEQYARQVAAAKAMDADKIRSRLIDGFRGPFQNTSRFQLEAAAFAWLLADSKLEPGAVRFLDDVMRALGPPHHVEALFLRQLADLTYRVEEKDWPAPVIARFLQVRHKSEVAAADPTVLPWTAAMLDEAERTRHAAEVRLWARGFASFEEADQLAKSADEQYQVILDISERIRHAQATLDEALALLPAYQPYLDVQPAGHKAWEQAVAAAQELATALAVPAGHKSASAVHEHAGDVHQLSMALAGPFHELKKPFAKDNLDRLKKACRSPQAGVPALLQAEALLTVPALNLKAEDRAAVWTMARELAGRLNADTLALDHAEDDKHSATAPPDQHDMMSALKEEAARARRHAAAQLTLLELGGMPAARLQVAREQLASLAGAPADGGDWPRLGEALKQLWTVELSARAQEEPSAARRVLLSWIARSSDTIPALDDADKNPAAEIRLRKTREHWTWLADHYRHQARDYEGLGLAGDGPQGAARFYAHAAALNPDFARLGPEAHVKLNVTAPVATLASSRGPVAATLTVERVVPQGRFGPLELRCVAPDAQWLQVTPNAATLPALPSSSQARQLVSTVPLQIALRSDAERSFAPRPSGVLVRAEFEGRDYHRVLAVPLQAASRQVQILVSANPAKPEPAVGAIPVRPLKVPQPYYVYLKNLTPRPRNVTLEMLLGDTPLKDGKLQITLEANETRRVGLPEKAVPDDGLPAVHGPLVLRASDSGTTHAFDQRTLRVEVASPRDYVRVTDIQFDPAGADRPRNKLYMKLQASASLPGPDIGAEMVLPSKRIPGLLGVGGGTLKRTFPAKSGSNPATLFAENIRLADGANENGVMHLDVDGFQRAFIFRTTFARRGDSLTPRRDNRPQVRWNVEPYVLAADRTLFPIEVDNAPPGATLDVSLGRAAEDGSGSNGFEADLSERLPHARNQRLGFWPHGNDGALVFDAEVRDWTVTWNTSGILGARVLRARLLDQAGTEIARAEQPVTIDGSAPSAARILDAPPKARPGAALKLLAEAVDPESGIAKVVFFVGRPHDDAIPAQAAVVPASPVSGDRSAWTATVPLPEGKKGQVAVSAQFTNGVGLTRFETVMVELTDAEVAEKKHGQIRGRVLEGPRPQPNQEVILRDARGQERARTRTLADGTFRFDNLEAGNYSIFCVKPESLRRATVPATVERGKTTFKLIELSL